MDNIGGDTLRASVDLVKDKNRIRTMIDDEIAAELGIPTLTPKRSSEQLEGVVELYAQGKIKLHVRQLYPLAGAAAAHRTIETRHGRGKIILLISSSAPAVPTSTVADRPASNACANDAASGCFSSLAP
ncbi:zinc-binding dehydrogenase [Nonomuraea sp. CA-143628]|uniref:zinc-binding dehydrogenase n=1 Tax=Nonomuraea sp. CA-143628 TaxID=3239997 RepID=UPI003D928658